VTAPAQHIRESSFTCPGGAVGNAVSQENSVWLIEQMGAIFGPIPALQKRQCLRA